MEVCPDFDGGTQLGQCDQETCHLLGVGFALKPRT